MSDPDSRRSGGAHRDTVGRVLRTLLRHGPISQHGLAQRTRLHQATISRVLSELKDQAIVSETSGRRPRWAGRGRRPKLIDLDGQNCAVLGIQLGLTRAHLGLVSLRGGLMAQTVVPLSPDPTAGFDVLLERGRQLVAQRLPSRPRLLGIGVGAAGWIDPQAGTVTFRLENHQPPLPVTERLVGAFGVPVFLSSNVHGMALAEAWFGRWPEATSLALLFVGSAIRLAFVVGGGIYHGTGPRDGMLGHAVLDPGGPPCACGQRGCLEALASDAWLEMEGLRLAQALPDSILGRYVAAVGSDVLSAVVTAARDGDPQAASLLVSRARWLARAIVLVHYALSPSQLFVAGPPQSLNDEQLELIRQEVAKLAPRLGEPTGVTRTSLPFPDIAILGAATLMLEPFFSHDERWASAERQVDSLGMLVGRTA